MKMLVYGAINMDHVYGLPHLVREGETLTAATYSKNAGGKGLNQATALAKAGADVSMAGAIGADGMFLKEMLEETGVKAQYVSLLDAPTGHAMIQVDAQARNSIVFFPGANQKIDRAMIEEVLSHFEKGDYLSLQNEISGLETLIELAHEKGMKIVLNPSPVTPQLLKAPIEKVDYLVLNEIEGAEFTGETEPEKVLDVLLEKYPGLHVVLTLGKQGSVYAYGKERIAQCAYPAKAVDTTAAGDTFTGYFMTGVMRGDAVERALQYAAMASSIAVSRPGAGASVPLREEVEAALAKL